LGCQREALQECKALSVEYRIEGADGRFRWCRDFMHVVKGSEGKAKLLRGILVDITESKEAEAALKQKSEELDSFFRVTPDLLCIATTDGFFLRLNPSWEPTLGYTCEELMASHFLDFIHPDDVAATLQALATLAAQRSVVNFINRYRCKDGTYRWLEWSSAPAGKLIYAAARDITEQKRVEEALRQSDQRYKAFFSHSNEGVWRVELDPPFPIDLPEDESLERLLQNAYLAECNLALAHMMGFSTPEEVLGKQLGDLFPASNANEERIDSFRSAARHGFQTRTVGFRAPDKAGNTKYLLRTEVPIIENEMLVRVWGITRDVTELKRAEESLRKSEELFRTTFENAGIGMALVDMRGHPIKCNPALLRMLGYTEEELGGMAFTEFTHPDDRELDWGLYQELTAGKKEKYTIEKRYITKPGQLVWGLLTVSLVRGADGRPEHAVGMVEDITERKRVEEAIRELNTSLEQRVAARTAELAVARDLAERADRLKSAFLATMSHELRTPLNSIIGFTGIILQGLAGPLNAEQRKQLDMVRDSARHLLALINDVLDISKIEAGQLEVNTEPFDLRASIVKVAGIVRPLAEKKGLVLRMELAPEISMLVSDPRRVEQVLLNLLNNAIKFTERGAITLFAAIVPGALPSLRSTIRISVADTGIGIRPENLGELFHPFRQIDSGLSRQHEGTGLGLAICRRLAELLGGEIHAASEWGKGSVFTLTLPMKGPGES